MCMLSGTSEFCNFYIDIHFVVILLSCRFESAFVIWIQRIKNNSIAECH